MSDKSVNSLLGARTCGVPRAGSPRGVLDPPAPRRRREGFANHSRPLTNDLFSRFALSADGPSALPARWILFFVFFEPFRG